YHQLDAIRNLISDITINKTSKNYLIEHSAGSGKTKTIAWLAHRLQSLHDKDEKNIFDSILIITDRIVVDQQLQAAIKAIDHKQGLVKVMDEDCTSSDLAEALKHNTKIVVSTIQKFRYILDETKNILDKNFAIIIDEAHSSTSGKNMAAVTEVLSDNDDMDGDSVEDLIIDEISNQGKQKNISMIAFTATPKKQTLQLFGNLNKEGKPAPFHIYGMKQAIEEGFILDVLTNYTTYKTFYELQKKMEDNPEVFASVVKRKINRFVDMHPTNIGQKVEIIIEHFRNCIMRELGGKAKAMVVTSSREAAVRYRNEFERYITEHNYGDIKALVAFSGKVTVDGKEYSEVGMNNIPENALKKEFDKDDYQVLLVANKYQTGFDQPKLVAMYVDKKLSGITAVQTLSRLNRICPPYNKQTFILDFKNSYDDIKKAFAPYYDGTILSENVNPEAIYNLIDKIDSYNFMDFSDVIEFNELAYKKRKIMIDRVKMESLIDRSLSKIKLRDIKQQFEIKKNISSFNKFYRFIIQATAFKDIDLHKKYNYLSVLEKELDVTGIKVDFNVVQAINISNFEQKKTGEYVIDEGTSMIVAEPEVKYGSPRPVSIELEQKRRLSEIIDEINLEKGMHIDSDLAFSSLGQIKDILMSNNELKTSANINPFSNFGFSYYKNVDKALIEGYEHNKELYKLLLDDEDIKKRILGIYMEDIYKNLKDK
ncbi:MAG: type I restriction endonuclease subunit R, partial [Bacilli bacterium]|nr:type I restriction endonuclease subunit R [Bacilli bacterium]